MDVVDAETGTQGLGGHQQPVRRGRRQRGAEGVGAAVTGRLDRIEAGQAGFHASQPLLQGFGEGAADRHRLADRFHRVVSKAGVPGNFSKVKRGIFTTT